ncbi:hypothetical protein [Bacillus badius]|uniref:hypothetical protein n=1 Tax=Bacillus badius TaxID=1455 RepID=UPI0007B32011|nr:hypothetical protein [Bacillus badius]KZR59351.1 hypothetical protein A3781_13195 [Bacillus badius]
MKNEQLNFDFLSKLNDFLENEGANDKQLFLFLKEQKGTIDNNIWFKLFEEVVIKRKLRDIEKSFIEVVIIPNLQSDWEKQIS